ncbi:WbqC family protein [Candidatus Cloacimonadota bacterium]
MRKSLTIAIHQPDYIPWMGYFYKLAMVDKFVFLDAVQYPRGRRFANRNRIKTSNGVKYLTIPVSIPPGRDGKITYNEIQFADSNWKLKHLRTLKMNYSRSPYFNEIYSMVESVLNMDISFTEQNILLINSIADYLQIKTPVFRLSELLNNFGKKNYLIIDICKKLNADVYFSGTGGGREYNNEELLNQNNIQLKYSDFNHPVYPQLWGEFIPRLSILDLLFNCGPESRTYLIGE